MDSSSVEHQVVVPENTRFWYRFVTARSISTGGFVGRGRTLESTTGHCAASGREPTWTPPDFVVNAAPPLLEVYPID